MTRFLFALLFVGMRLAAQAQPFAFVYIQGDKETPIYVKLEGEMQPRYGLNYCIIPQLAPGIIHVQVLFQQNKFPPQDFTLRVPEGGQRSLLVTRRDTGFALYDLQHGFYLPAGNDISQDRVPERGRPSPAPVASAAVEAPAMPVAASAPVSSGPNFIKNMELDRSDAGTPTVGKPASTPAAPSASATPVFTTTDGCPTTMDVVTFGAFYRQVLGQTGLDSRLTFLMDSDACPTPDQARIIARSLEGDEAKLRYLTRVVRRSGTPRSFSSLEVLFVSADGKAQFRQALQSR